MSTKASYKTNGRNNGKNGAGTAAERKASVELALRTIEKSYGKGCLGYFGHRRKAGASSRIRIDTFTCMRIQIEQHDGCEKRQKVYSAAENQRFVARNMHQPLDAGEQRPDSRRHR